MTKRTSGFCKYCGDVDNYFDRTLCPCEEDPSMGGIMHTRCSNCGAALDYCALEDTSKKTSENITTNKANRHADLEEPCYWPNCEVNAAHKVGDESGPKWFHNLTTYLCCEHMAEIGMDCSKYPDHDMGFFT